MSVVERCIVFSDRFFLSGMECTKCGHDTATIQEESATAQMQVEQLQEGNNKLNIHIIHLKETIRLLRSSRGGGGGGGHREKEKEE